MVEILLGDKGRLDFSVPMDMTDDQKKKFISLLEELFDVVEVEEVDEFRSDRLGSKEIHATWTAKELRTLLQVDDYVSVSEKLGRSEMSVIMRIGGIIPQLIAWCEDKSVGIDKISLEDIEKFLKEKEDKKLKKREQRKQRTTAIHKIEDMIYDDEPCMVYDPSFYGGECKDGFHDGCRTCPRSQGFIKTQEEIDRFNKILHEEFDKDEILDDRK